MKENLRWGDFYQDVYVIVTQNKIMWINAHSKITSKPLFHQLWCILSYKDKGQTRVSKLITGFFKTARWEMMRDGLEEPLTKLWISYLPFAEGPSRSLQKSFYWLWLSVNLSYDITHTFAQWWVCSDNSSFPL